jgi:hypothetical protein
MTQQTVVTPQPNVEVRIDGPNIARPSQILQAAREQRSELRNQLERLEERRSDLRQELTETPQSETVTRQGLEQRIVGIDQQIVSMEKQLSDADAAVARAAGIPGAVVPPQREIRTGPPEEAFVLGGIFMFVVLLPLAIAYARRIWKRTGMIIAPVPHEVSDRLTRIEQAVDAIAVEVERVGESQRYMTNLFADPSRAIGAGAAEPIELKAREAELRRR